MTERLAHEIQPAEPDDCGYGWTGFARGRFFYPTWAAWPGRYRSYYSGGRILRPVCVRNRTPKAMKFTIRDLFLVTVIVALAVGWAVDHRKLADELRKERLAQLGRLMLGFSPAEMSLPNSSSPAPN